MNPANGSSVVVAGDTVLEAHDLVLSFGETQALRGASVAVKRGEIVAVMGPSGSGKSTLLHCSKMRRDRFGFVFQFGQLVPELTAEENVALPLLLGGTHRAEALRAARSWFERLDLEGMETHRAGEMSGGQSQRVALARGLVSRPDVLFADEPTGSLDSLNGELVMGLLTGAAREQESTVVLVTHEPRVAAYADREVIVRDGRVATPASVAG
jgi:putative ABC transport system ATP-binding protein